MSSGGSGKVLVIIESIILAVVLAAVVVMTPVRIANKKRIENRASSESEESENTKDLKKTKEAEDKSDMDSNQNKEADKVSQAAISKAASMSDEDKVAEIMCITPEQLTNVKVVVASGDTTKKAVDKYPVGALCYTKQNIEDDTQAAAMFGDLQKIMKEKSGVNAFIIYNQAEGENADTKKLYSLGVNAMVLSAGDALKDKSKAVSSLEGLDENDDKMYVLSDTDKNHAIRIEKVSGGADGIEAVNAGASMLYMPDDFTDTYNKVLSAVKDKTISEDRLNDAVAHVLSAKGL